MESQLKIVNEKRFGPFKRRVQTPGVLHQAFELE